MTFAWIALAPGCANQSASNSFQSYQQKVQDRAAQSRAIANKVTSPARGTKECRVSQLQSAYKTRKDPNAYSSEYSRLSFWVDRSGAVSIAISESTYPLRPVYFLIDGKRYVGPDGDKYTPLDNHGLAALKAEKLIQYNWTSWPYKTKRDDEDIIAGFGDAYTECVDFLNH